MTTTKAQATDETTRLMDALELAWGLIANAGGGEWTTQTPEWQAAAARWRDEHWHPALDCMNGLIDADCPVHGSSEPHPDAEPSDAGVEPDIGRAIKRIEFHRRTHIDWAEHFEKHPEIERWTVLPSTEPETIGPEQQIRNVLDALIQLAEGPSLIGRADSIRSCARQARNYFDRYLTGTLPSVRVDPNNPF